MGRKEDSQTITSPSGKPEAQSKFAEPDGEDAEEQAEKIKQAWAVHKTDDGKVLMVHEKKGTNNKFAYIAWRAFMGSPSLSAHRVPHDLLDRAYRDLWSDLAWHAVKASCLLIS